MPVLVDQMGREVVFTDAPKRIISLVPSQTELLFHLGLDNEIAGVTKFCIHPARGVKSKTKIGGTKTLDIPLIRSLNPDLIIANKEENERTQLEDLMADHPTYLSDPDNLTTALQMINDVGLITGRQQQADQLSATITASSNGMNKLPVTLRVAYFIWRKPYMVAGTDTFIDSMLQHCGFINVFDAPRYPEVTVAMLAKAKPDIVLLSSEPYPFKQKHIDELAAFLPDVPIKLVDGEMFSWYGSRLLEAPRYFSSLIASVNGRDV